MKTVEKNENNDPEMQIRLLSHEEALKRADKNVQDAEYLLNGLKNVGSRHEKNELVATVNKLIWDAYTEANPEDLEGFYYKFWWNKSTGGQDLSCENTRVHLAVLYLRENKCAQARAEIADKYRYLEKEDIKSKECLDLAIKLIDERIEEINNQSLNRSN